MQDAASGTNGCFTRTCYKHPLCQTTRLYILRVLVHEVTGAPGKTPTLCVRKTVTFRIELFVTGDRENMRIFSRIHFSVSRRILLLTHIFL